MGKGGESTSISNVNINVIENEIINDNLKFRTNFFESTSGEPHALRRKQILKVHPEIESLYGPDWRPAPIALCMIISQLILSYYSKFLSWPYYLLLVYFYGGTVSHSLSLMTHEASHCLIFKSKNMNEYFAMLCNIGMGIPAATTFKRYHMEHHLFQGVLGKDVDIATYWEGSFFTSTLFKLIYIIAMPLAYSLRPIVLTPKDMNQLELINYIIVISCDIILICTLGYQSIIYLVLSLLLGHGLHPMSGHFIAEHCVFISNQETYSYYGLLNLFAWNVGYHNEHHDFPRIAGWNLPKVTKMAPEFYENLYIHSSWCYVLYRFITDPTVSPFNRMIRKSRYDNEGDKSSSSSSSSSSRIITDVVDPAIIMSSPSTTPTHLKIN